jgi:hypothetical protein
MIMKTPISNQTATGLEELVCRSSFVIAAAKLAAESLPG